MHMSSPLTDRQGSALNFVDGLKAYEIWLQGIDDQLLKREYDAMIALGQLITHREETLKFMILHEMELRKPTEIPL